MNSHQLHNRHNELNNDLTEAFRELTESKDIIFISEEADLFEFIDDLPQVDWINGNGEFKTGEVKRIENKQLIINNEDGVEVIRDFNEINDIYYKIQLIECIEEKLKN